MSRWFGLLEVIKGPFTDNSPIFVKENDPFVVRFHVQPKVWLEIEKGIPIHDDLIWTGLSFTRGLEKTSLSWTGKVRGSLVRLDDQDGIFLTEKLKAQFVGGRPYPLTEQDMHKLASHTVNRSDKVVTVSVPEDAGTTETPEIIPEDESRRIHSGSSVDRNHRRELRKTAEQVTGGGLHYREMITVVRV